MNALATMAQQLTSAADAAVFGRVISGLEIAKPKPVLFGRIPEMTDPLGKHWRQPKGLRDRVEVYETHAAISEADWLALPHYASSYPSGVYAGKVWRRGPWLCWYGRPRRVVEQGREKEVCSLVHKRALIQ